MDFRQELLAAAARNPLGMVLLGASCLLGLVEAGRQIWFYWKYR